MSARPARPLRRTPLWAWTATLAALVPLVVMGLVLGAVATWGHLDGEFALATCVGGSATSAAVWVIVGVLGARIARSLADIRLQALAQQGRVVERRGLHRLSGHGLGAGSTRELLALSSAVATLHARVQLADEVATRARVAADDAGLGLMKLLAGLVAAEESARGQLAAELHDTVAQSLLVANQQLAEDKVEAAADSVAEAEEQVRALMARTRPPELRDGDLAMAVSLLRADLHYRYGLRIRADWPVRARPLPLATAVVTYRFFQEALLNVIKHADVDDAAVGLDFPPDDGLRAWVRDQGDGFRPSDVTSSAGRHVGLSLLAERARLAGGSVTVTSSPGSGTLVELRLPPAAVVGPPTLVPEPRTEVEDPSSLPPESHPPDSLPPEEAAAG